MIFTVKKWHHLLAIKNVKVAQKAFHCLCIGTINLDPFMRNSLYHRFICFYNCFPLLFGKIALLYDCYILWNKRALVWIWGGWLVQKSSFIVTRHWVGLHCRLSFSLKFLRINYHPHRNPLRYKLNRLLIGHWNILWSPLNRLLIDYWNIWRSPLTWLLICHYNILRCLGDIFLLIYSLVDLWLLNWISSGVHL